MYDASVSFKHVCVKFDDVLQMQSTQQRLIPMLATCYGLHFAKQLLVDRYCEMKRTKDHKLVEEVRVCVSVCVFVCVSGFLCVR